MAEVVEDSRHDESVQDQILVPHEGRSHEIPRATKLSKSTQTSQLSRKRKQMLDKLDSWVPALCCKKRCIQKVGTERGRFLRGVFLEKSRDERKQELGNLLQDVDSRQRFCVDNVSVCNTFLIENFQVSRTLLSNVLGLPSANASSVPGRNGGSAGSRTKKSGVLSFLRILADELCDEIPNKDERHLPHGNKKIVFLLYQDNERRYGRDPCQESLFYRVWKQFLPNVKCLRRHGFTACDTCVNFKEQLVTIARVLSKEKDRISLKERFHRHLKMVQYERSEYRRIQTLSTEQPKKYLSVIIDGADQAKFGLPRFPQTTKRETGHSLKQKVTGIVFHGAISRQDFVAFLTSAENLPGGSNQTIDSFCRSLFVLMEQRSAIGLKSVPPTLVIQLDNTGKDNKNRYFFAFCDLLVHKGIFESVTVNFLPIGHTHEDIDRRFSRISVTMRDQRVITIKDLHQVLKVSQSGKISSYVGRVEAMNNFSEAISTQKMVVGQVEALSTYRKFTFERDLTADCTAGFFVTCSVGYKMIDMRSAWKKLPRKAGFFGVFLKKFPNMHIAPAIKLKVFSEAEVNAFEKRVRMTEIRIRSLQKTDMLRSEISRIKNETTCHPDWDFNKLLSFSAESDVDDTSEDDSDAEAADEVCYTEGEIVAVNCGSKATPVTPFWVGKIMTISKRTSGPVDLTVHWYELSPRQMRSRNGSRNELCYTESYRPMRSGNVDKIPASSVLCEFPSLTDRNCLPIQAQKLVREALDVFGDINQEEDASDDESGSE